MSGPLILGIESSCDETGVGIVRGHELLANEVASSVDQHARWGGVVPEVASRAHLQAMVPALQRALAAADVDLTEVDAIAVTAGPGLMGALVVGLASAKALAAALNKPLYGVNHLVGHVAVDILEHGPLAQPCGALLVSGGHTNLLRVDDLTRSITEVGTTIDDAAGEAYDKVARLLGLGYPGGPAVDRAWADFRARTGAEAGTAVLTLPGADTKAIRIRWLPKGVDAPSARNEDRWADGDKVELGWKAEHAVVIG